MLYIETKKDGGENRLFLFLNANFKKHNVWIDVMAIT